MGNTFFRTPVVREEMEEASYAWAELIANSYAEFKPDAMTLGVRDFAMGTKTLLEFLKTIGSPVLAANIFDEKSGDPLFESGLILEKNGKRIGVIGVVSEDWAQISSYRSDLNIKVESAAENAKKAIEKLGKVDILIALSSLSDKEVKDFAAAVPEFDFILRSNGGALSGRRNDVVGKTTMISSSSRGKYIGVFKLVDAGVDSAYTDISEKKQISQRIDNYQQRIDQMLRNEKVETVEELKKAFADKVPMLKRLERYEDQVKKLNEELAKIDIQGNYFEVDRIVLDGKVAGDPAIQKKVDEVVEKFGDPGAHKVSKSKLNPKKGKKG